ncbi:MAG: FG-GAP-like repeat-containing protein [Patescibacteria group bacterium]|nr:FG-GAP-like repeat-containing protein [Patescibacteria group bacterium]
MFGNSNQNTERVKNKQTIAKPFFRLLLPALGAAVLGVLFVAFGINIKLASAFTLTQITATPADVTVSAATSYTVSFKTTSALANNYKITLEFPAGFDISQAGVASLTGIDGTYSTSTTGQVLTITRTGGTSSAAGVKTVALSNVVNSATPADNYQVIVTTKSDLNAVKDGPTNSVYFRAADIHSETPISGLYYLRDDSQTHYQNNNSIGTGNYIGTLSATPPVSDGGGADLDAVIFFFDANGTYSQTNTVSNAYYHVWWQSADASGSLGYDTTGSTEETENESLAVSSAASPDYVGSQYLYAGKQVFSSPQSVLGNNIYNFAIKFTGSYPSLLSNPSQASFVILNLPDDAILQGLDTDSDGISDYDELFTYYTNPYVADTDADGFADNYEIDNGLNPVDPDQSPAFGKLLLKQFDGAAASDRFGISVSSIPDIDGDGKADVLVGAYQADPGGRSNAGSAYIFSSDTGSIIKQFDGAAAGDYFGYSVSSIPDIDGDGKADVLVGASYADPGGRSNAGSAYIFSSDTGSIIKQFNGAAASDFFGDSVSSIPDIDGDGKADVLVGAYQADPGSKSGAGSAYIFSSDTGSIIKQFDGAAAGDCLGHSVSSIPDIDGDGKADVLVGAYLADPGGKVNFGSAYIFSSDTGSIIKQFDGAAAGDYFGYSVSSIPDIDGDGKADVLVGAHFADPGGKTDAGSAYIFSSDTGSIIKQFDGAAASDYFGYSVSSIPDIDGDGKADVLVGAYFADLGGKTDAGSAYIFSSDTGSIIKQFNGAAARDYFGYPVSSIPDIDGDGKADVLVGAYAADPGGKTFAGSAYIYSSTGNIISQSWPQDSSNANAFDLDGYFSDPNNSTVPARSQTVTYAASTADNSHVDVIINPDNTVSFSQPAWWAGSETVTFTATDSTGLSSDSNVVTLTVTGDTDSTAPSAAITSPSVGSSVSGTITLTATSTDAASGAASVKFYYDDTHLIGEQTSTSSPDTYTQSWNSVGLDGSHTLIAVATDNAGNTTTSTPITVTVQNNTASGSRIDPASFSPPIAPAGGFALQINNGQAFTTNPNVSLSLTAGPDTTAIALSNIPGFENAVPEPYVPNKAWDWNLCWTSSAFHSPDNCSFGLKTVYAKAFNAFGRPSDPFFATISYVAEDNNQGDNNNNDNQGNHDNNQNNQDNQDNTQNQNNNNNQGNDNNGNPGSDNQDHQTADESANYISNTLVLDQGTVYLIMGQAKYGFTSLKAFLGLGYLLKHVVKGDASAYPQTGVISLATQTHIDGSWIISGRTVFYVSKTGYIPVPSWEIFLNNGGSASFILKANHADIIDPRPILPLMVMHDSRVGQ